MDTPSCLVAGSACSDLPVIASAKLRILPPQAELNVTPGDLCIAVNIYSRVSHLSFVENKFFARLQLIASSR